MHADVKDNEGKSPLDVAVTYSELNTAVYLMKNGCDSHEDKVKIGYGACRIGRLGVIKELVEQHNINLKGDILWNSELSIVCYYRLLVLSKLYVSCIHPHCWKSNHPCAKG